MNKPIRNSCRILAVVAIASMAPAHATLLNAPQSGSFTMNLDSSALVPYWGYRLSSFWDTAASDIANPTNTAAYFSSVVGSGEIAAVNQVFALTSTGLDPTGQPAQRAVKATSANFAIDSVNLTGITGTQIGMTGIQGFYAPKWQTACCGLGGGLINGDFSIAFDRNRQNDGRSGWHLLNNIYFTMATYDFANLSLVYSDADNWRLSGDLWMSPENGAMLKGAILNDVGDFCLGTGHYTGCNQLTTVPIPASFWLFASAMISLIGTVRKHLNLRKFHV